MPARLQIIDCRRVLSWTYTYGYYVFAPENEGKDPKFDANKHFFEFLQVTLAKPRASSLGQP